MQTDTKKTANENIATSTTKVNLGNGAYTDLCSHIDGVRTWWYDAAHVTEIAGSIAIGEEVYTSPAPSGATGNDWYEAGASGDSPRFGELRSALAARGIELVYMGSRYWHAAEAAS